MTLAAFLLSGDLSEGEEFRRELPKSSFSPGELARESRCNGRSSTIGDHVVSSTIHSHPPFENGEHIRLVARVKERVKTDISPVLQIYNNELDLLDEDDAATAPTYSNIQAALYRHRAKSIPPLPESRAGVTLEGIWTQTDDGREFLCVDDGEDDRLLLFATTEMLELLSDADILFMDGTFFVCPNLWLQVYIIHCLVNGKMFPVAFALLPNKTKRTYVRLFTLLKDIVVRRLGIELSPEIFQIDYEAAVISAISEVFPDSSVRGCLFHYSQALWRQVLERGLSRDYMNNPAVQAHVRRAAALPLLPLNQVQDAWFEVIEQSPDGDRVAAFNDYVTSTWVEDDAKFPAHIWNQHENTGPRSNNHLEGFHSGLKKRIPRSHPNIYQFVEELKKIEKADRRTRRQFGLGGARRPRARVDRDRDQRIERLKVQLSTGVKFRCSSLMLLATSSS
ncbi:uncharacterized protein LOC124256049 [Haliotis rubra]|uniref:uncharacterized protein LOC124256049 n=1 Tax=Haliotis rubra TaxID=36100 RepID=UPI001EE5BAF0|nr:uncharacterized protein LOC124256049 [Haliotis rubra]